MKNKLNLKNNFIYGQPVLQFYKNYMLEIPRKLAKKSEAVLILKFIGEVITIHFET